LKNAQSGLPSLEAEFCTHPSGRLHFNEPWGGLKGPETRTVGYSDATRTR
jgi:hypothetical protein